MKRTGIISLALALGSSPLLQAGTSLSKATIAGNVPKMKACLDAGEKVDEIDKWGWTPLMWAVYYRNQPATQFLLEQKADPNIQSTRAYSKFAVKTTPLLICAYYGLDEPAELLLKAGAKKDLADQSGKQPMDLAKEYSFESFVTLLEGKAAKTPAKPTAKAPAKAATEEHPPQPPPPAAKAQPAQQHPVEAEPPIKTEKAIKAEPVKPAPKTEPKPEPKPEPAPKPAPIATPAPEPPPPPKKPAPAKKPAPVRKQEAPKKSEPPAIK